MMRMKKVLILAALVCLALIFCAGGAALAETGADYYLVGSMNEWQANEAYKLSASAGTEGEYCLASVSLEAGNEFKIISLNDYAWYPDGFDNNYVVSQTGTYDVYFRPNLDGGEDWYEGCIYVAETCGDDPQTGGQSLVLGENTLHTLANNSYSSYPFTPTESGTYRFYSVGDDYDPYAGLFVNGDFTNGELVEEGDDDDGDNFDFLADLIAGTSYTLCIANADNEEEDITVYVEKVSGSGGESGDTITVCFVDSLGWGTPSIYWNYFHPVTGDYVSNNWPGTAMEADGQNRYKAAIPAAVENIRFHCGDNQTELISTGISNGATWHATGEKDYDECYCVELYTAPAVTPAPVTVVNPANAGTITEVIPAPIPTDPAYGSDSEPAHAFAVEDGEGYELESVVYQFDDNEAQSLIFATADIDGYTFNKFWYIKESFIPAGGYESLTVTANFAQAYTISVPDGSNITVSVGGKTRNYSKAGNTVALGFNINNVPSGCATDALIVAPEGGEAAELSLAQSVNFPDLYWCTFTMPAAPVTVSYKPFIYGLSANITGGGGVTFTVDGDPVTQAATDAIVTLTVTPDDGYALESLTYTPAGGNPTDIAVTLGNDGKYTGTFTMPAADVTVDAAFIKSIAGLNIELDEEPVYDDETQVFAYTGKAVEPEVSVTRWVQTDNGWEEVALVQGTDYTVTYTNNTGSPDAVTDAAVTLTGIGEYGETKTIPFRISPFNLADCKATVPNPTYNDGYFIGYFYDGSWNDNHGGIVVKDNAGNTLDYYHYDEASGKMVGDYIYAGTESLDYPDKYTDDLCTHVGESCRVTLKACGDWAGTLTVDIVISPPAAEGVGWSFEAGVLSITGSGAMTPQNTFSAYPWYQYSSCITDIVISEGITSVPKAAFGGSSNVNPYTNVKTVTLPTTLTDIGECAFAYCSLETINLDYVETIESQAFNQCGNLSIVVPAMAKHTDDIADTVKSIDEFAFEACGKVTFAIVIGDTENGAVTATVNNSAVEAAAVNAAVTLIIAPAEGCELESVTYTPVGDNEEEINADAETGAYTFTMPRKPVIVNAVFVETLPEFGTPDFTLPAGTTTIEASAFEGVEEMTVMDAHACTSIGKDAFKNCTGLTQIRLPKDCAIDQDAFTGCGTVYVFAPAGGTTEAYCGNHGNLIFVEENEDVPLESFEGGSGPVYVLPKK